MKQTIKQVINQVPKENIFEEDNLEENNYEDNSYEDNSYEDNSYEENGFAENVIEKSNPENILKKDYRKSFKQGFKKSFSKNYRQMLKPTFEHMSCSTQGLLHCEQSFPLLGGKISIVIYDIDPMMLEGVFDDVFEEGLRLQKIFNFYDDESELSRLNESRKMAVSPELLEVLHRAFSYAEMTGGKYDVSMGKNIVQRKKGLGLIDIGCSYKDIVIKGNVVELMHPDVLIDLGSIAKGYIADKIIDYMKAIGIESGFIDARGEMKIYGKGIERVTVQHPRCKEKHIHNILFENNSIATSGDYKQYYGSHDTCHIVGSRDVISVTVVADELMDADAAATCLFVIGLKNIDSFMKKNTNLKAFVIDKNLKEHFYNGFEKMLMEENENENRQESMREKSLVNSEQ